MSERVLYIVNLDPSKKFGSLEEQIFLLACELKKRGGLLLPVFTRDMGETGWLRYRDNGLSAVSLDLRRFRLSSMRRLFRLVDQHNIDVVHWHLYHPINWYVAALRLFRPRVVHHMTDHNSRPYASPCTYGPMRPLLRHLCRRWVFALYAKVFAVSQYVLTDLKKQAIYREVQLYHHFVNTTRFCPDRCIGQALRVSLGWDHHFVLLVVAHLIPEKGVAVVMRALAELPPDVVLWVVGDGPERKALGDLAKSMNIEHRMMFFGLSSDVCRFMQAADCLVCPSLWQEAAGLVVLEAMACGLPVVASDVGGIPEFVLPDETGYLFPAGDHEALRDRLTKLRARPDQRNQMCAQARSWALAQFSHENRVLDAVRLYESMDVGRWRDASRANPGVGDRGPRSTARDSNSNAAKEHANSV